MQVIYMDVIYPVVFHQYTQYLYFNHKWKWNIVVNEWVQISLVSVLCLYLLRWRWHVVSRRWSVWTGTRAWGLSPRWWSPGRSETPGYTRSPPSYTPCGSQPAPPKDTHTDTHTDGHTHTDEPNTHTHSTIQWNAQDRLARLNKTQSWILQEPEGHTSKKSKTKQLASNNLIYTNHYNG